ncbi:MAG: CDP-alcohol phosphatidyltransferase family protein [Nanoarchaeota archaeon]
MAKDSLKNNNKKDEFAAYILRSMSKHITKILIKTSVTPNQITFLSFLFVIAGSIFFIKGGYQNLIIGSILAFFAHLLDCIDGEIARAKKLSSILGQWFDAIVDYTAHPILIFSLAYGLRDYFGLVWACLAIIAYPMQYLFIHYYKSEIVKNNEKIPIPIPPKYDNIRYLYGSTLFYPLLLIVCLINRPLLLLIFYATFGNLFWIGIIFVEYVNIKKMSK